jgi:ribonuclease BN (tRNA processing enzyme)
VTHTHSDHVAGLPMLIQAMWLEGRKRPLPVWMPRSAIRPLRDWLHACFLFESDLGFPIRWRGWSEKSAAKVGTVKARPFRTSHLEATQVRNKRRHPEVGFDAFCLLIEAGKKRIAYSADLGTVDDLEPLLRDPLDLLVVELAHFHPDVLTNFLRGRAVCRVAITHMGRAVRAKLVQVRPRMVRSLRPRRVAFAVDGDVIRI